MVTTTSLDTAFAVYSQGSKIKEDNYYLKTALEHIGPIPAIQEKNRAWSAPSSLPFFPSLLPFPSLRHVFYIAAMLQVQVAKCSKPANGPHGPWVGTIMDIS